MKDSAKYAPPVICLLLFAATTALFWRSLDCDFVNYDDPSYITSNGEVQRGLTWEGLAWAFKSGEASNWHPLTWLSHMADASLYGLVPRGHHLTSVLLHAVNAPLLFLTLLALTGNLGCSAMVAALFALHPTRVESVTWVSERKDVLSTAFWILTVWAYARYAKSKPSITGFYLLALAFFALGLMSKPMLVTLPFVLLLLDYWPLGRVRRNTIRKLLVEKIPFFVLAAASSVVTFIVQQRAGAVTAIAALTIGQRIANAFVSYVRYLEKAFWPVNLSVLYPHPRDWPAWEVAGAIVLLTIVTALVIWRAPRHPYLLVGWLWYLGTLVPVIGLVQVGIQSMADRYTYIPLVGIFIMVVWGANELLGQFAAGRAVLWCGGAAALIGCAYLTPQQISYWTDSETLFQHAVAVTTDNYLAYNNIGFYLSNEGKAKEAMEYYESSLQINPRYEDAHNNLGYSLFTLGSNQAAITEYIKALSINSNLTDAHNNLGNALGAVGKTAEAMHEYQVALVENPHYAEAHNNLGIALAMHNHLDDAIEQFRLAVRDRPNYANAYSDLGNALAMENKWDDAVAQYLTCLKLDPNDPQVHNNLANVLTQTGRFAEAMDHYQLALKLNPNNPEAHFNLGYCLERQGRRAEAAQQYEAAVAQRPDYPQARQQLELLRHSPQ